MGTLIVMDHTGDSRTSFDAKNAVEVDKAMARFKELLGQGYTAAERTSTPGESKVVRELNPEAETVFFPRLVGG